MTCRSQATGFLNQPAKVGVQLWRASGDVNLGNSGAFQRANAVCCRLPGHHLQTIRPGIHVAVAANLVAPLTHIDLKDFNPGGGQRD